MLAVADGARPAERAIHRRGALLGVGGVASGSAFLVAASWLVVWSGLFLVLRGQSAVVRVGGGLVLSLGLMALAISCS